MKILFIGDYSNYHVTLARRLRRMGHECTIVSSGSRCMDTERDIDLIRTPGKLGGLMYAYRMQRLIPKLKGYDVVQLINPNFLELKPKRIYHFFKKLKEQNGKIGLSVCGNDPVIVDGLCRGETLRYSEFRIGHKPSPYALAYPQVERDWLTEEMREHCNRIYNEVNFAISSLFEYQLIAKSELGDKLHYLGIPIDVENTPIKPAVGTNETLNLFVGIKSECEIFKGSDLLLAAAQQVAKEHPDKCIVSEARDLPYNKYCRHIADADVVLDQVYSYTPATNALEAMAMGKVVVSGAEPEYYDFIGETELHPIVNVLPDYDDIYLKIKQLVIDRDYLNQLVQQGREFVKRHNDVKLLANKYLDIIS